MSLHGLLLMCLWRERSAFRLVKIPVLLSQTPPLGPHLAFIISLLALTPSTVTLGGVGLLHMHLEVGGETLLSPQQEAYPM